MQKHSQTNKGDFETFFLLLFTKELIRNTSSYKNTIIKKEVKSFISKKAIPLEKKPLVNKEYKNVILNKNKNDVKTISRLRKEQNPFQDFFSRQEMQRGKNKGQRFSISESELPVTFNYLKPTPTSSEINLKKLNPLVKDPLVEVIECNGPNEKIVVMGRMGRKNTPITLTKEEIDETIKTFSEAARIPISEGMFKVVFGKLILSAIISEVIDSKFVIKKMTTGPVPRM